MFARTLIDEAAEDDRIVAVTAAMPDGTGLNLFNERYPGALFRRRHCRAARRDLLRRAGGGAGCGHSRAIYSTFLQRGYDQVVHDVALQNLPVRFAIDRAGLVGADGATHAGSFDVAYLSNLPNFTVMAAADEAELRHMVATAVAHDSGPIAFRFPRGEGVGVELPERGVPLEIGRGRIVHEGARVALLSFGTRLREVERARERLAARGISPTVADARFAKPLDRDLILRLAADHEVLVTIEEGAVGGFGSHVAQLLAAEGVFDLGLRFRSMVLPDAFIDQAAPVQMYEAAGLQASDIEATVLRTLGVDVIGEAAEGA